MKTLSLKEKITEWRDNMDNETKKIIESFQPRICVWLEEQIYRLQQMIDENKVKDHSRCTFVFYDASGNLISHPYSRRIGENLNLAVDGGEAGLELMRLVFYALEFEDGDAAQLEKCWDGIGLWLH